MRQLGFLLFTWLCVSTLHAIAQDSPFAPPRPLGGPIVHPDGRIMSGMDFVKSPWSGGLEAGLNGSEGNSQVVKIRLGADFKYDTPEDVFTFNGWYGLSRQMGVLNENKALLTARNEIPFYEQWAYFAQAQLEYDDFRAVDWRIAIHNGLSYTAIKDDTTLLKLRAGLGAAREIGGPRDEWIPEGLFGADFEYTFTERTKFVSAVDYFPDIADWAHFRVRARASFDFLLDKELNLTLRLGMMDRYDSQPGVNIKKNDIDYFMTLLWRF